MVLHDARFAQLEHTRIYTRCEILNKDVHMRVLVLIF